MKRNNNGINDNSLDISISKSIDQVQCFFSSETKFIGDPFCSIDLSGFKIGERIFVTPCMHIFHYSCLAEWVRRNASGQPNCPNCNQSLKDKVI